MTEKKKPKPLKRVLRKKKRTPTNMCGPDEPVFGGAESEPPPPTPTVVEFGDVEVVDLRHLQSDPAPKSKVRRGKTSRRDPKSIIGVTLHQTACHFGTSKGQVRRAGGDKELAQQMRALGVACHVLAFQEGWVAWANQLEWYLYHANGLSGPTLCLEIEGHFSGLRDDPTTVAVREDVRSTWKGNPDTITDLSVASARCGLKLLVDEGRAAGMPITELFAHRQSSPTRRSDPGEEMWQRVGLDYGVKVLGLQVNNNYTLGEGRPIPTQWDLASDHRY